MVDAATQAEQQLVLFVAQIGPQFRNLQSLPATATPAEQEQAVQKFLPVVASAIRITSNTIDWWSVLLKKSPAYAEDARTAETHLKDLADLLDGLAEATRPAPDDPLQTDVVTNAFHSAAETVWNTLHEFDPTNALYLKKAREPATTVPNIHDLEQGHDHED